MADGKIVRAKRNSNFIDITGNTFGLLTVIREGEKDGRGRSQVECICACGGAVIVNKAALKRGLTKSCGCLRYQRRASNFIDISGQQFGRLIVLREAEAKNGVTRWECQCSCGRLVTVNGRDLRSGNTKSCHRHQEGICSIEGCERHRYSKELCRIHYDHLYRNGDPLATRRRAKANDYLRDVVLKYEGDDCLIWPFCRSKKGYGWIHYKGHGMLISRAVCFERYGEPPSPDYEGAHSCGKGTSGCCNPKHVRWATQAENMDDRFPSRTSKIVCEVDGCDGQFYARGLCKRHYDRLRREKKTSIKASF